MRFAGPPVRHADPFLDPSHRRAADGDAYDVDLTGQH